MITTKTILACSLAIAVVTMAAFIQFRHDKENKKIRVDAKGFAVVELFTSEGCSSCPPADKLIEQIGEDDRSENIYILAFHVDYWDHLGWKDRFSDQEFSKRQRQYAAWMKLESVYTPQIVVNGASEFVGSNRDEVLKAIAAALEQQPAKALTLKAEAGQGQVNVTYEGVENERGAELVLALIEKSAQSSVKAGENSGRNLSHVQIVRRMTRLPVGAGAKKDVTIKLPSDFDAKGWELIGFVQRKADGHIIAAARAEL